MWWVTAHDATWGALLRLSYDAEGRALVRSDLEAEAEGRQQEAEARSAAEARVRELEAELGRLQGDKR